jgi:folate-binding Fe-S cluster repair protein YgfZ
MHLHPLAADTATVSNKWLRTLLLQVLVNAQARCLDLATALVLESSVMLLVSPDMKQPLLQRLDKFIFPADDVTVDDVSERCGMLTIMGPQADDVMQELAGVSRNRYFVTL